MSTQGNVMSNATWLEFEIGSIFSLDFPDLFLEKKKDTKNKRKGWKRKKEWTSGT